MLTVVLHVRASHAAQSGNQIDPPGRHSSTAL